LLRLIMRLFAASVILLVSNIIFGGVYYPEIYQPITVGVFAALLLHSMEIFTVQAGTPWVYNTINFFGAFFTVLISGYIMPAAYVSLLGALLTALLFAAAEHFLFNKLKNENKKAFHP
jgi:membrane-bound metal-dependent hydrolase YbcI (DUF457 family)